MFKSKQDLQQPLALAQSPKNSIIRIMEKTMEATIVENQMEKKMENEMETGIIMPMGGV